MKTEQTISSETQDVRWGLVIEEKDEEMNSFEYIEDMTDEQLTKIGKRYNVSPALLQEINWHLNALRDAMHKDLADIWRQVST